MNPTIPQVLAFLGPLKHSRFRAAGAAYSCSRLALDFRVPLIGAGLRSIWHDGGRLLMSEVEQITESPRAQSSGNLATRNLYSDATVSEYGTDVKICAVFSMVERDLTAA